MTVEQLIENLKRFDPELEVKFKINLETNTPESIGLEDAETVLIKT